MCVFEFVGNDNRSNNSAHLMSSRDIISLINTYSYLRAQIYHICWVYLPFIAYQRIAVVHFDKNICIVMGLNVFNFSVNKFGEKDPIRIIPDFQNTNRYLAFIQYKQVFCASVWLFNSIKTFHMSHTDIQTLYIIYITTTICCPQHRSI